MGSTFGAIQVASSGMTVARAGIEAAGNNIANAATDGYTRTRVNATSNPGLRPIGNITVPAGSDTGQGAKVQSIERLGSELLESRLRSASGEFSYNNTVKNAYATLETSLNEPSDTSISSDLQSFWSSWQDLANNPGDAPSASTVIEQGKAVAQNIASGYNAVSGQWDTMRTQTEDWARQLNTFAEQLSVVNEQISEASLTGSSTNALLDARDKITLAISDLSGAQTRINPNGTADVSLGGNLLVSGSQANKVNIVGSNTIGALEGNPVRLEWASRPGTAISVDGGSLAGGIDVLAPRNANGTGGLLAEAAATYNALATEVATQVNAIHRDGQTSAGVSDLDFFALTGGGGPAALSLVVVPKDGSGIATGSVGAGALDGGTAQKIGEIALSPGSPDKKVWASFVSTVAVTAQTATTRATSSEVAFQNAVNAELSNSSVDLTEENIHLITSQDHFEAASRVVTTMMDVLDTIINIGR